MRITTPSNNDRGDIALFLHPSTLITSRLTISLVMLAWVQIQIDVNMFYVASIYTLGPQETRPLSSIGSKQL